jgi:signal transduction histidine kinase
LVDLSSQRLKHADTTTRSDLFRRDVLGAVIRAWLLVAFFSVLFAVHRLLTQLTRLADTVRSRTRGDERARAPERGIGEVRAAAHAFNQMADHMQQESEQRCAFLAGVAHDMRNPLGALRMSTFHFRAGFPLPSEEMMRSTMAIVDRQVTRLERMVGDFLDAERIECGFLELKLAPHDLRALAEESVQLYTASSVSHDLMLRHPDDPVIVRCDGTRIEQVLNNLISNAIKYSPAGGPVRVAVARDEGYGSIEVTDRGIGIAEDDLEQVFQPFRRSGASRESIPGAGLGLWVSRRIVEAHGGSLEVSSELGVGSTFHVRLRLEADATQQAP